MSNSINITHAIAMFCPHGCKDSEVKSGFSYSMTPILEGLLLNFRATGECGHEWDIEILLYVHKEAYRNHVNKNIRIPSMEQRKVNYYEYIQSKEWRVIADEAKNKAGRRCQVCNCSEHEIVLNVHHRTYENLGNESPEDLIVLCSRCHFVFENLLGNINHPA